MHFGVATAHVRLTTWRVHPIIVASFQTETFDRIETQLKLESLVIFVAFCGDEQTKTLLPVFPLQNTDWETALSCSPKFSPTQEQAGKSV